MVDWLGAARGRVLAPPAFLLLVLAPPALLLLVLAAAAPSPVRAEVPIGELGRVEQLPDPPGDHWVWVAAVFPAFAWTLRETPRRRVHEARNLP